MSIRKVSFLGLACVFFSAAFPAKAQDLPQASRAAAPANGLGVNLPLVARLVGAGPTLYITTVDVQNNSATATQVDWYLNGVNLRTSTSLALAGSISSTAALVAQGTGDPMRGRSNAHFDDIIDSFIQAGYLNGSIRDDGFIGSILFVFNGFNKRGQGVAIARFYSAFGGGTIGQALKGREISAAEPQKLVALARDTRGKAGPQLYANIFVNNTGVTPGLVGAPGPVTVRIQAYANTTGQPTGTPLDTVIGVGETVGVSDVLAQLKVPPGEDTIIVYVTVISGTSAIDGVFAQVDATTRDGSTTPMSPANF
jgi:hypothetical protein